MVNDVATVNQDIAARLAEFQRIPILHEDDPEWEMGEANLHSLAEDIIRYGLTAHLVRQPQYRVFANLNLHFQPRFPSVYISPDVMVVTPSDPRRDDLKGYYVAKDGPAPVFVTEVLSAETAKDRDLGEKVELYALIGVDEYLLIDGTAKFLPQRLLLKSLKSNRTWDDRQDPDGGITSRLGFRVIWDRDDRLRVMDASSGKLYPRPDEVWVTVEALEQAEEKLRELEAKLTRLKGKDGKTKGEKPRKRRRKS